MSRRPPKRYDPNRLFNREGFVHYRRRYSKTEWRLGFAVGLGLLLVLLWVLHRGGQADPQLFAAFVRPRSSRGTPTLTPKSSAQRAPAKAPARGPLPVGLAPQGWKEGPIAVFDPTNVYIKIDGREGYYKSFGFQQLHCATLQEASGERTIDLELYDLASAKNALGAYGGEQGAGQKSTYEPSGVSRIARNALYLARGKFYLRAIGSDESPQTRSALVALKGTFFNAAGLGGSALPWAYRLFGGLGITPSQITYFKENAFSFEFGRDVYAARIDSAGSQLFVVATAGTKAAHSLAARFLKEFGSYGERVAGPKGEHWIKDRYIGALSTARAVRRWVIGVRATPDLKVRPRLQALALALATLPERAAAAGSGGGPQAPPPRKGTDNGHAPAKGSPATKPPPARNTPPAPQQEH